MKLVLDNGKEVNLTQVNVTESEEGVTNYMFETDVPEFFGVQISVPEENDPLKN